MTNATENRADVARYFDALLKSYDVLVEATNKANERGIAVSKQVTDDIAKGQREAIEMSKKLATETTSPAQFYSALLESAMSAQSRALSFTQIAYQQGLEASGDARDTVQKLVDANREVTAAATEAARAWWTSNPIADAWAKTAKTAKQQAAEAAKDKS